MSTKELLLGLVCVPLGLCAVWVAAQGLGTGEIEKLAKHGHLIFTRAGDPFSYWLTLALWAGGGAALVVAGVRLVKNNLPG